MFFFCFRFYGKISIPSRRLWIDWPFHTNFPFPFQIEMTFPFLFFFYNEKWPKRAGKNCSNSFRASMLFSGWIGGGPMVHMHLHIDPLNFSAGNRAVFLFFVQVKPFLPFIFTCDFCCSPLFDQLNLLISSTPPFNFASLSPPLHSFPLFLFFFLDLFIHLFSLQTYAGGGGYCLSTCSLCSPIHSIAAFSVQSPSFHVLRAKNLKL